MMKKTFLFMLLFFPLTLMAQSWDYITSSKEYYYGVGHGADTLSATRMAMAELAGMISTTVSSEFSELHEESTSAGHIDHKSKVRMCVNTYSFAKLNNLQTWIIGRSPDVTVRCYMLRTEMDKVYEDRIKQAKDMVRLSDEALETGAVGTALQHYYLAYCLVRSLQRPQEAVDNEGRLLVNWLPLKIEEVMNDVRVDVEHRDGEFVDLHFTYRGRPVRNLNFTYSDGQAECSGKVNSGSGTLEMAPGYEDKVAYKINIDYVCAVMTENDPEMRSVLEVVGRKPIGGAEKTAKQNSEAPNEAPAKPELKPSASQLVSDTEACAKAMLNLADAIRTRRYNSVTEMFTAEGKDVFDQLIAYGKGRIVGEPNLTFFKGSNGRVVARGLQMAFSFRSGTKTTFTEEVIFTFNPEGLIENVVFGLGQEAENDILCREAPGWKDDTREQIMEFMENYKTAYCLKRFDYISDIFSDDAVIIVGNVTKRKPLPGEMGRMSLQGKDIITENRYTKSEYLRNLKRCFARNEFINIHFTRNEVQYINKIKGKEFFAIQIGQEYNSSTYGDKGYLFLLVNITNPDEPQIQIRTWQPNEVDMEKLYSIGNFFDE